MTQRRAAIAVVLGAATWGTTGTSQELAGLSVSPAVIGASRVVVGAFALVLLATVTSRMKGRPRAPRPPLGPLVVAGVAIAAYQVLFFLGVAKAGVAIGTVVGIGSVPVLTGLVARVVDGAVPSKAWWVATLLAVIGCGLVLAPTGETRVDVLGVTLALGAGLAYAVLTVTGRRVLDAGVPPTTAMAWIFVVGALPGSVLLLTVELGDIVSGRGLALVAWLALVTVAIGYALYAQGLRTLAPSAVGTLTLTEPLVAAALGVLLLREQPSLLATVGAALLALGLVVIARARVPAVKELSGI